MKKLVWLPVISLLFAVGFGCIGSPASYRAAGEGNIYSFAEINQDFGPGPFSVASLAGIYGTPRNAYGTIISAASGTVGIVVIFDGISFVLAANHGEVLSFGFEDSFEGWTHGVTEFRLEDSDEQVMLWPSRTIVTGDGWRLPREIAIGDGRQRVIGAYAGDQGEAWNVDGSPAVSYAYAPGNAIGDDSKTGAVSYGFVSDRLVQVTISWYNLHLAFD
ncbi:MAG: hypothetical protein FWG37_03955 [Clostridia bacterium]|nr:hypothetical protein [Clostridia bacterium]